MLQKERETERVGGSERKTERLTDRHVDSLWSRAFIVARVAYIVFNRLMTNGQTTNRDMFIHKPIREKCHRQRQATWTAYSMRGQYKVLLARPTSQG